jgi:hypothetical protein
MNVAGLAAQIHNDLQDLTFALEYDEQGAHQHVPERIQGYLSTLYTKMGMLNLALQEQT